MVQMHKGASAATPPGVAARRRSSAETERLVDLYKKWFDIVPATSAELVRESQRVRYQVYCLETGFENISDFPDGYEHDQYDERSVCSLLVHKPSGAVAGTVRLILPHEDPVAHPLPAMALSDALRALDPTVLPRARTGEISRFAISKQFRQRREDTLIPALYESAGAAGDQRVIPHITLGLMQAILRMSIEHRVDDLAIIVEPALDRLIRKLGIYFQPIGPLIEHHGRRRAHYRNIAALLDDVYDRKPEIWEVLTDGGALWPAPGTATTAASAKSV